MSDLHINFGNFSNWKFYVEGVKLKITENIKKGKNSGLSISTNNLGETVVYGRWNKKPEV